MILAEDILDVKPERNKDGRVLGLNVISGCAYRYGLLINNLKVPVMIKGFRLISDKVNLFGSDSGKLRYNLNRKLYPGRFIDFKNIGKSQIVGKSQHNRYKNGKIRPDLTQTDKNFFKNNYGCLAQRKWLRAVFEKEDLRQLSPAAEKLTTSDILVSPVVGKEALDPNPALNSIKVEFN